MSPDCAAFEHSRRTRVRSEFRDQPGQSLGPAGISNHHVVAACDGESRDLASDVPGTNNPYGFHDSYILPHSTEGDVIGNRGGRLTEPDGPGGRCHRRFTGLNRT
jgi:hypothetical protein